MVVESGANRWVCIKMDIPSSGSCPYGFKKNLKLHDLIALFQRR